MLRQVRFGPTSEVGQRHLAHRNDAWRSYSAESNVPVRNANGAASKVELGACLAVPEHAAVVADRLELDQHCRCRMRKAVPVCGALVEIVAVSPHLADN